MVMSKVRVQRTATLRKTVRYCVEDLELPAKYIQFLGALLVVDEDDWTLHQVYPLMGNTVYVSPDMERGVWKDDWTKVTVYVTDVDKGMPGAFIKVDEDGQLLDVYPPPRRIVITINWVPGFMPKDAEQQVIGTYYGHDLGDFEPLMDMLQGFADMAKEQGNE